MITSYGGHSFTNQDISLISYPSKGLFRNGLAVLAGLHMPRRPPGLYPRSAMSPDQRIEAALFQGFGLSPG